MAPHLVEAAGTRRRLQALAVAGHDAGVLAAVAAAILGRPVSRTLIFKWRAHGRQVIDATTAAAVIQLYDRLRDQPGTSASVRIRAIKAGFRPAAAWAGQDIDDPAAQPRPRQHPRAGAPTPDDEDGAAA